MKAVNWTAYGPPEVLEIGERPKPIPKSNEILIRIRATTVTAGDTEMRSLRFPLWVRLPMRLFTGLFRPRRKLVPGMGLSGEIESVGEGVTRFGAGQEVMAATNLTFGAHAEYVCLPENGMIGPKPGNLTHEEAACVPVGGIEAISFLHSCNVQPEDKVLVNGAGGTIGSFAVQLAKQAQAHVTAVDLYEKHDMLKSIGADITLDHTGGGHIWQAGTYDVVLDVVGKVPFAKAIQALKPGGRFLIANPRVIPMIRAVLTNMLADKRVKIGAASEDPDNLVKLKDHCEAGVVKAIVDRTFPLDQIVEAHRYAESGHKIGNVAISVQ